MTGGGEFRCLSVVSSNGVGVFIDQTFWVVIDSISVIFSARRPFRVTRSSPLSNNSNLAWPFETISIDLSKSNFLRILSTLLALRWYLSAQSISHSIVASILSIRVFKQYSRARIKVSQDKFSQSLTVTKALSTFVDQQYIPLNRSRSIRKSN